ncbi:hypothetical protein AYI68_g4063 [Smittium mucronatum]|uniref:Uncharacterized protein n=1 Tax=Smittium mucronatum TaxID=133383 RepID=A0A1R0GYA6_9FUNG|nr:hypothetical protein AYI68_g4063 [Smittium mucronatum]
MLGFFPSRGLLDIYFENRDDRVFHLVTYGIEDNGLIDITVGNLQSSYAEAPGNISILIYSSPTLSHIPSLLEALNSCQLSSNDLLIKAINEKKAELFDIPNHSDSWGKVLIANSINQGWWSVYLVNCKDFTTIDFWSRINVYQRPAHNFLSAGQIPLPFFFLVTCILQHLLSLYWLGLLFHNPKHAKNIHYCFFLVLLFLGLETNFYAVKTIFMSTGIDAVAWNVDRFTSDLYFFLL